MVMQANSLRLDGTLHLPQFIDVAEGEKADGDDKDENTKKGSLKRKCKVCWKHKLDRKTMFECKKMQSWTPHHCYQKLLCPLSHRIVILDKGVFDLSYLVLSVCIEFKYQDLSQILFRYV